MKAINLSNALTMSLLYCLSIAAPFAEALPKQDFCGGAIVLIEPFVGESIELQTAMLFENGETTHAYTLELRDCNGQLQYEVTTQSLQIDLPSNVLTRNSRITIFAVGYSATYNL